jgi:N-formylglutamate deformylase
MSALNTQACNEPSLPVVLHIPHASTRIPADVRGSFLLNDEEIAQELLRLTDHYTDELFGAAIPGACKIVYPVSRIVVDPERFDDDDAEPAAQQGMGVIYTHGSQRQRIRERPGPEARETLLERFYRPHHRRLEAAVAAALQAHDRCLVLDCHSFPSEHLPSERSDARPEICIGTDALHSPPGLRDAAIAAFRAEGFSVMVNEPFAGALVPGAYLNRDLRVSALMIEIGRWLYMDTSNGQRSAAFEPLRDALARCLRQLALR